MTGGVSERRVIFLLAAVQFVNVLDFMIVMPLGPDFAAGLGIPMSRLGVIGGSYTAAAAVAGVVGALFLDRFDRRRALAAAMLGLVGATALAALARGFPTLVAARVLAGLFGGPAAGIGLAILSDVVPPERRGRAMGAVMGAFSAASVFGVPAGLALARAGGWRAPFVAVAALGSIVVVAAIALMPPMRAHRRLGAGAGPGARPLRVFLADRKVQLSLLGTTVVFMGTFALIPNLATFLLFNLGYPRAGLELLYLVGGVVSFFGMRLGGAVFDRRGPLPVTIAATALMLLVVGVAFLPERTPAPVLPIFVLLMLSNASRGVATNTLASKVPPPPERARFMSAQSAVQHLSGAIGAMLSSVLLSQRPDRGLAGMPRVALFAMALAAALPPIVAAIDRRVRAG